MKRIPAVFIGHGSPMNAIEDNAFSREWRKIGGELPRPEFILAVSAHWFTDGTRVNDEERPKTVYDMFGFPDELYRLTYPAPGAPVLAREVKNLLGNAVVDNSWGIDHGTWSVLHAMFPVADIPVFQLSVNAHAPARNHYEMGRKLRALRERGVLIFGSGNVVHNLRRVEWGKPEGGYDWADRFDAYVRDGVLAGDHEAVIGYERAGEVAALAVPTPDHYFPLLYILGAVYDGEKPEVRCDARTMGSLSMTSYLFR
jgi:4,5-DOPA dioxygenase extradiol